MVEWKIIDDVCDVITGGDAPNDCIKGQLYPSESHPYAVYSNGDNVYGYSHSYRIDRDSVTISSIGNVGSVYYRKAFFTPIIRLKVVIPKNEQINTKYLYYYLFGVKFIGTNSSLSSMKAADIKKVRIPVPSIIEQSRIVGILDTFSASIENLKQQIAQRRKQYEHYRDQLLDLEGKEGVEMKMLGEVCEIKGRIGFRGYTREDQVAPGEGALSLSPGNIVNGKMDYSDSTYISWKKYEESPEIMVYEGDVLFCKTGSTVGKVAVANDIPYKATINPQLVVLKDVRIGPKYLYFYLTTPYIQKVLKALAGVGSVPNISQAKLGELKILLPSLSEQSRIVSILDTFETRIANLEQQLAQRERQYEYYRNKLLTFE